MASAGEVIVLPFHDKGHTFPAAELSCRLALRGLTVTLFLPSPPPSPLPFNVTVLLFSNPPPPPLGPPPPWDTNYGLSRPPRRRDAAVEQYIAGRTDTSPPLTCAIIDVMMTDYVSLFERVNVRHVSFFTSSAFSASRPRKRRHPPPPPGLVNAAALLVNTCVDLEQAFIEQLAQERGKPVWGVGPLLRSTAQVNDEVLTWLDGKPARSVIYVSFGTVVAPPAEELEELAGALAELRRPFVWALAGDGEFSPEKKSDIGLIIRGWAPQQMILGHVATAAFMSHCGWNSTAEALAAGVPVLAWPVRGDQYDNAELVTEQLGVGHRVRAGGQGRADLARAIEALVADQGVRARAAAVRSVFGAGFPDSADRALDCFVEFLLSP